LKKPKPSVVTLAGITVEPAKFTVTGWEAAKPEPVTVTDEPIEPLVGFKAIEEVTVKLAEAELTPSLAKTDLTPAV
jgi:hypothetical protein